MITHTKFKKMYKKSNKLDINTRDNKPKQITIKLTNIDDNSSLKKTRSPRSYDSKEKQNKISEEDAAVDK